MSDVPIAIAYGAICVLFAGVVVVAVRRRTKELAELDDLAEEIRRAKDPPTTMSTGRKVKWGHAKNRPGRKQRRRAQ